MVNGFESRLPLDVFRAARSTGSSCSIVGVTVETSRSEHISVTARLWKAEHGRPGGSRCFRVGYPARTVAPLQPHFQRFKALMSVRAQRDLCRKSSKCIQCGEPLLIISMHYKRAPRIIKGRPAFKGRSCWRYLTCFALLQRSWGAVGGLMGWVAAKDNLPWGKETRSNDLPPKEATP